MAGTDGRPLILHRHAASARHRDGAMPLLLEASGSRFPFVETAGQVGRRVAGDTRGRRPALMARQIDWEGGGADGTRG